MDNEIYSAYNNLWKLSIPRSYASGLDAFLDNNPFANKSDFNDIEARKIKSMLERLELTLDFNADPEAVLTDIDESQEREVNLYDYWYYKEYLKYIDAIDNKPKPINESTFGNYTISGQEKPLIDFKKAIEIYDLLIREDLLENNISKVDFIKCFDLNCTPPVFPGFKRGGQTRFCYILSKIEINDKQVLSQFGIKGYYDQKTKAIKNRAIKALFKKDIELILNPKVLLKHS